jgi:protein-disulfide isomerase
MRVLIAAAVAGLGLAAAAILPAQAEPTAEERQEIERIVRDYILNNPEIIEDALIALETKRREEEAARQQEAIAELSDQIFDSPHQAVVGNSDGDVSLVEFFDYNCGYCRRALNDMLALMESNPDLRMVLKEFPILSQGSMEAARISVAVNNLAPDKYLDFHRDMFARPGEADRDKALAVARGLGLDPDEIDEAAARPEVDEALAEVRSLAAALGVNGTPSYVVGGETVFGAVGFDRLQEKVGEARRCGDGVLTC